LDNQRETLLLGVGYAFISAYLKGEEAKTLTSSQVSDISKEAGIQDVLDVIRETDVGNYLQGVSVQTFDELDEHLWLYFGECLRQLEWFKNVPAEIHKILRIYILKYDVLNIKAALQGISTGKKMRGIPVGVIYNNGLLDELRGAQDAGSIASVLKQCKLGDYASILEEYDADEGVKSQQRIEARLDGEYSRSLLGVTRRMKDGSTLSKAFNIIADMANLQIILRTVIGEMAAEAAGYAINDGYVISRQISEDLLSLKLSDIPGKIENTEYRSIIEEVTGNYDRSKSVTVIEEIIDKHKFRLIKEILSPRVLSPLVIVWYLILKEIEIRNLRLILKAAFDNISLEEIKDYLVLSS
jgi:V/A-type H+-transporting ATPase subunit C